MLDCTECTALVAQLAAAHQRGNRLVHDADQAREAAERAQRDLDAAASQRRHWTRVVCDRCGDAMEFSTTLASDEEARNGVMRAALDRLGWMVSDATAIGLGMEVGIGSPGDRCAACVRIYYEGRPLR